MIDTMINLSKVLNIVEYQSIYKMLIKAKNVIEMKQTIELCLTWKSKNRIDCVWYKENSFKT